MSEFEQNVMRSLGRIESKVDTLAESSQDHELRIRNLENEQDYQKGQQLTRARIGGFATGLMPGALKFVYDWLRQPWHH